VRAVPIPQALAQALGGERVVIGESDPTRDDVRPCEYVVGRSTLYPGRPTVTALIEIEDDERQAIAEGGRLLLTLDGGGLPWSIDVLQNALVAAPDDHETPRGRDGADTGCTEVPDEQQEGPSAASTTNVLGHRDAAGSHLVALQERDAALAELADARLALAVHTGRRSFVLDPDERAAVGRALAALDEEEVDGA